MRKNTIALAVAGLVAAGSLIYLAGDWMGGAVRLSISMFVLMLMMYPLTRVSAPVPTIFYLWRDKRLTFPRYLLIQAVAWSLIAIIFTVFRWWLDG